MKRAVAILSLALLACTGARLASAEDDSYCSNASLTGKYGFVLNGTIVGLGPISIVGTITYDGSGNLAVRERAVINGNVLPPETFQGTYDVKPDCTGSASNSLGHHSVFVIVNHGKTVHEEGTDSGSVLTILIEKQ
jgi:hypothetical protein